MRCGNGSRSTGHEAAATLRLAGILKISAIRRGALQHRAAVSSAANQKINLELNHGTNLRHLRQRPALRQQHLSRAQCYASPLECESAGGEGTGQRHAKRMRVCASCIKSGKSPRLKRSGALDLLRLNVAATPSPKDGVLLCAETSVTRPRSALRICRLAGRVKVSEAS